MSGFPLLQTALGLALLAQGMWLVFWPDRALAWQYWKYTRIIGAKPASPGQIDRIVQRFIGLGSLAIGLFVLISVFRA